MDQNTKEKLMSNIRGYGRLCAKNKKYVARKLYEKIESDTLTDREQFMKWLEEP
jgi:hypothetical protein